MRIRPAVELSFLACVVAGALSVARTARADDDTGHRYGLVGEVGGGFAGIAHTGPLPSVVGFTDLGVEFMGEIRPWGLYLRGDFLSSGGAGRWTAYSVGPGVQYRLFGTSERWAVFLRGGVVYERWLANTAGCPVDFFVPTSCFLGTTTMIDPQMPTAAPFSTTADMLGLTAGVRVEAPVSKFYVSLGVAFVPTVSIDSSFPAATAGLRFDLEVGFRDERKHTTASRSGDPDEYRLHR
jgi:hypothetical protein